MSKYEDQVALILKRAHIAFEREKTFSDLRGGRYRFDFYLSNNICLEIDGPQHYTQVKHFQKRKIDFMKTQEHDRRKNAYCLAHKIPLYRIPYWELPSINTASDLFQDKFKITSKWHCDRIKMP